MVRRLKLTYVLSCYLRLQVRSSARRNSQVFNCESDTWHWYLSNCQFSTYQFFTWQNVKLVKLSTGKTTGCPNLMIVWFLHFRIFSLFMGHFRLMESGHQLDICRPEFKELMAISCLPFFAWLIIEIEIKSKRKTYLYLHIYVLKCSNIRYQIYNKCSVLSWVSDCLLHSQS